MQCGAQDAPCPRLTLSRAYISSCKGIGSSGGDICRPQSWASVPQQQAQVQVIKDSPSSEERGLGVEKCKLL